MDLIDRLREISARIPKQLPHLQTEEATKNALVMPFINALGYDVFDPTSVVPEFTADVGTKKGEKVDYVILDSAGKPIILIECKIAGTKLDEVHASQLYRYFSVTESRVGILTDGVAYRFFSDLEEPNKMDSRPFLEFTMLEVTSVLADELKKFAKDNFDLENILSAASELKYTKGIKKVLTEEWASPTDEFVRLLTSRVYSGRRLTQAVLEQFTEISKRAMAEFLSERVNDRIKSALEREAEPKPETPAPTESAEASAGDGIVTTQEELQGYYVVKAILGSTVDTSRITLRDRKSYCGILLDDTNRKPICRFYFDAAQKYLGTFDAEKHETRRSIDNVDGIFQFADELRQTVMRYLGEGAQEEPDTR